MADKVISDAARLIRAGVPVPADQAAHFLGAMGELLLAIPENDLPSILKEASLGFLDLYPKRHLQGAAIRGWHETLERLEKYTLANRVKTERERRDKQDRSNKRAALGKAIFAEMPSYLSNFKLDLKIHFDPANADGIGFGEWVASWSTVDAGRPTLPENIIQFLNLLEPKTLNPLSPQHRRYFKSIVIFRNDNDGSEHRDFKDYQVDYDNQEI
jgi:hypothetical protein